MNENYDSYSDKEAVERKFRMAMASEARAPSASCGRRSRNGSTSA